jgi:hypothetical protein
VIKCRIMYITEKGVEFKEQTLTSTQVVLYPEPRPHTILFCPNKMAGRSESGYETIISYYINGEEVLAATSTKDMW